MVDFDFEVGVGPEFIPRRMRKGCNLLLGLILAGLVAIAIYVTLTR